jgi:hypothetical protein
MNADLCQLQNALFNMLDGLDLTQTQLRPIASPHGWSIQQIVEHLLLTHSSTEAVVGNRLVKGRPTRTQPNLFQRLAQPAVTKFGYFPHGRIAPAAVIPPDTTHPLSGQGLINATAEHLYRLDGVFSEAKEAFGSVRCATHEVLGPLSIDQWAEFHLVHGLHHVRRIAAIRRAHHL